MPFDAQRARTLQIGAARALSGAGLWLLASTCPAMAQDALRGKRLFLDTARMTGSGISCVDCHGGLPPGLFGIGRAANDPAAVERAVNSIPQMTPLRGRLVAPDFVDLAAYIGQPGVPSPALRGATSGPAATGSAERLDYGSAAAGSVTAASRWHLLNDGAVAMKLSTSAALRGEHATDFAIIAGDCSGGRVLASGEACSVDIVFRPAGSAGARRAAVAVGHDWVKGEIALALNGEVAQAAAPPTPALTASGGGGATGAILAPLLIVLAAVRRHRRWPGGRPGDQRRHPANADRAAAGVALGSCRRRPCADSSDRVMTERSTGAERDLESIDSIGFCGRQ